MAETVLVDRQGGVQTLTLNRPERLNAFTAQMFRDLAEAVRGAERDDAVRALVLTGAGRGFSAGADVADFTLAAPGLGDLLRGVVNPLVLRLRSMEKPVLAAVNGVAAGAGMSLALACDIRYAGESARFVQAFVGVGLVQDAGSSYFLPRLVGIGKALELAWTGEPVGARDALELGLVSRVVEDQALLGATQELAARLARGPARALALIKRGLNQSHGLTLERVLEMEAGYQEIASRTADFREGATAFREKRAARFGGS